jgi:hypothetical protein
LHPKNYILLFAFLSIGTLCYAQSRIDSLFGKLDPQKWSASIEKKAAKLQDKIIAKSQKTLSKLQKQEEKIYRKMLQGKDSIQAKASLVDIKNKYTSLQDKLKNPVIGGQSGAYIAKLDTLTTALKFLDQNGAAGNIKNTLSKTQALQDRFQQAEEIKKFIRERKQQLKEQLERLGLVKQLKKFNKQAYYYAEQLKEYKEILKDSKKRERKALELLSKTKLFKDFMQKNSFLASLFRLPGDPNDPLGQAGLAGLQTRALLNNLIQQQIATGGLNAQVEFQQNMQSAQNQVNQLKKKISQSGGGGSDDVMPEGFKPNEQKTKGLLKRLEYGTNFQTQKATNYFPVTSDIGLSLGYKLNDRSVIGIGASYKMGMGRGWNHIRITNEGLGLRSFIDWKIKGSFWVSGGYEMNHRTAFERFDQLGGLNSWAESGLLGISKTLTVKNKVFKNTKAQILWDFLSYEQLPQTQPIIFRISYNFK